MAGETGPTPVEMGVDTRVEKDKSYREEKKINGAHFKVEWDNGYESYVIYFPDVDISNRKEIPDEVLRISDKIEDAQEVLKKAVELANVDLPTWESDNPDKDVLKEIGEFITAQSY